MGIEFENGTVKVSGSYSLKIPGSAAYSSEDAYVGLSLEFPADGDSDQLIEQSRAVQDALVEASKLAVFKQLGVEFTTDNDGTLKPKLQAAAPAPKPSSGGGQSSGGSRPSGGGGNYTPPKASPERVKALPRHAINFGNGPGLYIDQRPLKSEGVYRPGAADFKNVENKNDVAWLQFKDGSYNQDTVAALEDAGVDARAWNDGYGT